MRHRFLWAAAAVGAVGCANGTSGPLGADRSSGIFFVDANAIAMQPSDLAWGAPARVLRDDASSGVAIDVELPAGWRHDDASAFDRPVEIVVIEGALDVGGRRLVSGDYLGIDAETVVPPLGTNNGARFVLFADGGLVARRTVADVPAAWPHGLTVVTAAETRWVLGTAMADAGRDDVPLRIRHYRNDPDTGARTYLVAVEPGITIPWEVHDVAEEAYVLSGDYTLTECFDDGPVTGTYRSGGYFYRPPGIAHNGPLSGTSNGVVMLIRTPGPLTVELVDGCG